MQTLHLIVHGHVQGVGYRFFIHRVASALGVTGRARNLADGTVEVLAEGEHPALEKLLYAARTGGPRGEVTQVEETWGHGPAEWSRFGVDG